MTDEKVDENGFGYNIAPFGKVFGDRLTIQTYENSNLVDGAQNTIYLYLRKGAFVYVSSPFNSEIPTYKALKPIANISGKMVIYGIVATHKQYKKIEEEAEKFNFSDARIKDMFKFVNTHKNIEIDCNHAFGVLIFEAGDNYLIEIDHDWELD